MLIQFLKCVLFFVCLADFISWIPRIKKYKTLEFETEARLVGNVFADILIIILFVIN